MAAAEKLDEGTTALIPAFSPREKEITGARSLRFV